ncbi:hypothetical protein EGW08_004498, partial [Elysia chlorotica]
SAGHIILTLIQPVGFEPGTSRSGDQCSTIYVIATGNDSFFNRQLSLSVSSSSLFTRKLVDYYKVITYSLFNQFSLSASSFSLFTCMLVDYYSHNFPSTILN